MNSSIGRRMVSSDPQRWGLQMDFFGPPLKGDWDCDCLDPDPRPLAGPPRPLPRGALLCPNDPLALPWLDVEGVKEECLAFFLFLRTEDEALRLVDEPVLINTDMGMFKRLVSSTAWSTSFFPNNKHDKTGLLIRAIA